ncbi:MAG: C1 family peptidase [Halieaceae bacterium]|nr:C1 family peptidase [Halieaceae bacterium]
MSLLRGTGYRPDDPDPRDWDEAKLGLSVSASPPSSISLGQVPIYNQGRTSSCVAQAIAGGIEILERKAPEYHDKASTPSRLFIYFNSRRSHSGGPALFDNGTYLRTAAKAMERLGVPDESMWKFSQNPMRVNRRPSFAASMRGKARSDGNYYRILPGGDQRIKAIKAALLEGLPVAFGTLVTPDFLKSKGSHTIDKPSDTAQFAGGHAMLIVGYDVTDEGLVFEVRNSWGTGWRDDGYGWLTEDYIRWASSRDFQIIKGWKRLQETKLWDD